MGHSLAMWSLWFPDGGIVGVGISEVVMDQLIARGANVTGNIKIVVGDTTSEEFDLHRSHW